MGKINDTIGLVKTGLDVQISLATAEEKDKLAEAKLALADLKNEIVELREENLQLREAARINSEIVRGESGAVWHGSKPYCGGCFGMHGKLLPLIRINDSIFDCPACKARYRYIDRDRSRLSKTE